MRGKRIPALLLSLAMVLVLCPGTALATEPIDLSDGYEVRLDGEDWKVYPVEGKNGTISLEDLNITVQKGQEVLPSDKYVLNIEAGYEKDGVEVFIPAASPYGIADNEENRQAGFSSYYVTATAKEGSGFQGSTERREFMVWDRYSFNWFGATTDFGQTYKGKSTWFWHDYYAIPVDKVKAPTVTAIDGTKVPSNTYRITYFKRNTEPVDFDDPDYDRKVFPEENPLSGLPEEPGTYFARIDAVKAPYYGTSYVDFDILPKSISKVTVSGLSALTYTGKAQKPAPVVKDGSVTLKKDRDYTLSYKNNTKAGTATVTVTGKGKYTGTVKKTFQIKAAAISKATAAPVDDLTCTGKALKPAVKLTFAGKTLTADTDYTLTYKTNKAVGTATVTATGKGNFTGTKKVTFRILPKGTTISKLTAGKKKLTVKWKKQAAQTAGYELQYSTDKKFKKSVKTVTVKKPKTTGVTIKKLTGKKTYYVRIRTWQTAGQKTYRSPWSKAKSAVVKK